MTQSRKERMANILDKVIEVYEQFLSIVEDEIIEPLSRKDKEQCLENLRKFGKKITVPEIIRIVIRGACLLSPFVLKYDDDDIKNRPRLSEEYIKQRLDYFKNRVSQLNKQGS